MSWRVPSTPNSRSFFTQPSTTPAGPPPSYLTDKSTTPPGPPPRSALNSSFNPSNDTFVRKTAFVVPDDDDEDDDDDASFDLDGRDQSPPQRFVFNSSVPRFSPPRGLKRSYDGKVRESSGMATIAKGLTAHVKTAELREVDNVILQSEELVSDLDRQMQRQPTRANVVLTESAARLTRLWSQHANKTSKNGRIGPDPKDGFSKANFLASLLLQLHYPHTSTLGPSRSRHHSISGSQHAVPLPQALLTWLNTFHVPFQDDYAQTHATRPSPSASEHFWDSLCYSIMRGKFDQAIRLLTDAGWEHASSAIEDGYPQRGYTGIQLRNTEIVAARALEVLRSCPGLGIDADWDVRGVDWADFRQRIKAAKEDLATLAEGDQAKKSENVFSRSMRENVGGDLSISQASRRAESKVPWSIYLNFNLLYDLLVGTPEQIISLAQDWVEASILLTVWWDGADETNLIRDATSYSLRKSMGAGQRVREVDVTPLVAYRKRMADAFNHVTTSGEDYLQINTMDSNSVGLACVMEDSVSSVLDFLKGWSMVITVSVLEIAAQGQWLSNLGSRNRGNLLEQGFSSEDLLVLSHAPVQQSSDDIDRDKVLSQYADLLSSKKQVGDREGWELAVSVLNRLGQEVEGRQEVSDLLDRLELSEESRVDKVLQICSDLGILEQRRVIAERFADSLAETTQLYGTALMFYARANAAAKLRSTLALLTSMSLLHSTAMPTANTLDPNLASLISKDRIALRNLAKTDLEAATLLSSHLSGYATLRRFYDLRDQDAANTASNERLRPLERQRHAAAALFGVIKSAIDCIPGGLYDPNAESVVPVDGLLALFGEALPLLGQPTRIFTEQHAFSLLAAAEDFAAAPSRIRENAASLLSASLGAYRESNSTATGILKRNKSDMSASSSWEMLANSVMPTQSVAKGGNVKVERAWDWRKGIVSIASVGEESGQVMQIFREALVKEVARGWGGMLNW